ncbi:U1 small nuclear ribonucleoprotein with RRM domain [Cryptosporidium ubiquitum]|uniref:U1 small nuclear ribonucleoprotein with RRM domain n=1 Tax=Cryptosporidium ubiquitum TaxID=857276 RepID=A0A1J4MQ90_9CRYT|nr:U1 small nuclear ribonucleoprotein with RRM domain [Cryptosporidium ubiquitum]OII75172.1 U1 small nuclear ribonucleoprotein with RRM domain [Cryptosporidium ubiquitum]
MLKKLVSGNEEQPANKTLYCKNLNDKINKKDLKILLFELFIQFGIIEKITIRGGSPYRGQAFILFQDLNSAINAKNSINGMYILGKPINIEYAKTNSILNPGLSENKSSGYILGPKMPESK